MFESQSDDMFNESIGTQELSELAREVRNLFHIKQDRIIEGEGDILDDEGTDGDMHIRIVDEGVRLCIKAGGQWFKFKPEEEE